MKTKKLFSVRKNSSFCKVAIVLSLLVISGASLLNAQVTVGANTTPSATLDVVAADPANATIPEGIIAPRLTGDQIKAKDAIYLAPQNGAVVYATAAVSGTPAGKTRNIVASGYYYYDHPNLVWQGLKKASVTVIKETFDGGAQNYPAASIFSAQTTVFIHYGPNQEALVLPNLTATDIGKTVVMVHRGSSGGGWQATLTVIEAITSNPLASQTFSVIIAQGRARTAMWIGNAWVECSM